MFKNQRKGNRLTGCYFIKEINLFKSQEQDYYNTVSFSLQVTQGYNDGESSHGCTGFILFLEHPAYPAQHKLLSEHFLFLPPKVSVLNLQSHRTSLFLL